MISTAGRYRGPDRPRILPEPMERDPPIGRARGRGMNDRATPTSVLLPSAIEGGMGCLTRAPGPDFIDTRELQPQPPVGRRRSALAIEAIEAIESDDAVRETLVASDMARRHASGGDG